MLPPLMRLGSPDGPGAFICSEPWSTRLRTVVGKRDHTYGVYVVLKGADGVSEFFRRPEQMTVHEFKALTDRIMPRVGLCAFVGL